MTHLEYLRARILQIAETLKLLQTKIEIYSASDRFAMEIHQTRYMKLDQECLDLMVRVQELEAETPPELPQSWELTDQAVS